MNDRPKYPRLKFYLYKARTNQIHVISKETYDELNGYEPMQYRPENWESYDKNQKASYDSFQRGINAQGYLDQIHKIAVSSEEDFLKQKALIEKDPDFVKWYE